MNCIEGGRVQAKLKYMTDIAKKMFDVMEEDEKGSTIGDVLYRSYSDSKTYCPSPDTPTPVPPELTFAMRIGELADVSCPRPLLLPLRLQAMGNLMPTDMKCFSSNMYPNVSAEGSSPTRRKNRAAGDQNAEMKKIAKKSPDKVSHERPNDSKATNTSPKIPNSSSDMMAKARQSAAVPLPPPKPLFNTPPTIPTTAPSPPPIPPSNGSALAPSPPKPLTKGAAPPPPPPLGIAKALRPRKATTKLKRSTHMGNMYRILKGKVEGSSLNEKVTKKSKTHIGVSAGKQQGMADALAEMTKRSFSTTPNYRIRYAGLLPATNFLLCFLRSTYFQQIEEDVRKHAKSIMNITAAINSFQTKDMAELIKFHKYVEQHLEQLTDETQVILISYGSIR